MELDLTREKDEPGDLVCEVSSRPSLELRIFGKLCAPVTVRSTAFFIWQVLSPAVVLVKARSNFMSSTVATQVIDVLNYIGGTWRASSGTEFVNVTNPASGELLARTPV